MSSLIRWGSGKKQYIDKESSFFPDTWSTTRVQSEIQHAYYDALKRGHKGSGKAYEYDSNGRKIILILRSKGDRIDVHTAWPDL